MRGSSIQFSTDDPIAVVDRLRHGISAAALGHFQRVSAYSLETISEAIQVPIRTLRRRREAGRLRPDESDRLYRFATLFERAVALFDGDADAARQWLACPAKGLAGHTPLEFGRTEVGARAVEDLIGQLEHGVFP